MQDGAKGSCKGLYICTDSFIYADVEILSQYLSYTYNIKCSIHKSRNNYRIYILAKSVDQIKNIILPFMHKTFLYKLGL